MVSAGLTCKIYQKEYKFKGCKETIFLLNGLDQVKI